MGFEQDVTLYAAEVESYILKHYCPAKAGCADSK
jgi:hypothetical protein